MSKKKRAYESPIVYDFTQGVGNSVQAQNCRSGRYANAACNVGNSAANNCTTGLKALKGCSTGPDHQPGTDCKSGPSAFGQKCKTGGYAVGKCRSGGLKM
ncbi:MAG: hypothetical protein P9L88_04955 [Candidatus Tantalella remota]|nr:hypothetical protein [Candidatus Tantalella remota]